MNRDEMLDDCVCPICGEPYDCYADLYACLLEHCDDGIEIAGDYLEEAGRRAAEEEFDDEEFDSEQ